MTRRVKNFIIDNEKILMTQDKTMLSLHINIPTYVTSPEFPMKHSHLLDNSLEVGLDSQEFDV